MSHMDYGFYFFEEKKKEIYMRVSLCVFFFHYCLLVGVQQPSAKVSKLYPTDLTLSQRCLCSAVSHPST